MGNFDSKKIVFYLLGIVVFLILIIVVQSIDTNSDIEYAENTNTPIPTVSPTNTIKKTATQKTSAAIKNTPDQKRSKEDLQKRKSSWKSDGSGDLAIAESYRKAFIKAVNNNDFMELEFILIPESVIYKKEIEKIKKMQLEKIKLEFKSIKLVNYKENQNESTLIAVENIGIKKENEINFTYKDYEIKYIFVIENQGVVIKELTGGVI